MDRRVLQLPSQFLTGTTIGTNSPKAEMVIYAGVGWLNAEARNRGNFGQLECPGVTVKTGEERNSVADSCKKRPVGFAVAIEIGGDNEVPCPLVLADGPLRHCF